MSRSISSKYLNEAVDQIRRAEHKELHKEGDESLSGTRYLWLYCVENLSDEQWVDLEAVRQRELKTARGWALKEAFRYFWDYRRAGWAAKYFEAWYWWAMEEHLEPVVKVARMLKKHLQGLLNYFGHRITNAASEGFNSRIQSLKSAARGFRNFENYRLRILFYCGKLDLLPDGFSH